MAHLEGLDPVARDSRKPLIRGLDIHALHQRGDPAEFGTHAGGDDHTEGASGRHLCPTERQAPTVAERDPAKVAEDVRLGYVTPDAAARDYGVKTK